MVIILTIVIATSIWVAFDSAALLKKIPSDERRRICSFATSPTEWALSSALLWIVCFPWYLAKRTQYVESNRMFSQKAGPASDGTDEIDSTGGCPKCGGDVKEQDDGSGVCSKCGEQLVATGSSSDASPMKGLIQWFSDWKYLIATILFFAICNGVMKRVQSKSKAIKHNPPTGAASDTETYSIDELHKAYAANSVAADQRFKGKSIGVSGIVAEVGNNNQNPSDETAFVVLLKNTQAEGVVILLSKAHEAEVAKLKQGDEISITGTFVGVRQQAWVVAPTLLVN